MSSRERWTVYPLLFLTLAIALRTRIEGVVHGNVRCGSLSIVGADGKTLARLGNAHEQGRLEFYGPDGKILLAAGAEGGGKTGLLSIQNATGNRQVQLLSNGNAGILECCGPDGYPQVVLTASSRGGLMQIIRSDRVPMPPIGFPELMPRKPDQQPVQPPQPEQPAPAEPAPPAEESQPQESTPQ